MKVATSKKVQDMLDEKIKLKELEDALEEGREIAKKADLSDEERVDLKARVDRIESIKGELAEIVRTKAALAEETGSTEEEVDLYLHGKSLGDSFVSSDEFMRAKSMKFRGDSDAFEYRPKAEPTPLTLGTALPGLVVPDRIPGIIGLASYPSRVTSLIPKLPTDSDSVTFYEELTETSTIAAQTAEGAEKGNFELTGDEVTEQVEVIAGMAAVSRQTLRNAAFMAGFVNTRMTLKLDAVEEDLVLNGTGANGQFEGLLTRTTSVLSQGTDTLIDAVYMAMDMCWEDGGFPADAVIFRPSDWQDIVLAKDGNERYYGTGPFAQAIGDSIWGAQVVKSIAIAQYTVLAGAFRAASFLAPQGGLQVRTSDSHSDYFKKNKVAVLIEKSEAFGVFSPLAFCNLSIAES